MRELSFIFLPFGLSQITSGLKSACKCSSCVIAFVIQSKMHLKADVEDNGRVAAVGGLLENLRLACKCRRALRHFEFYCECGGQFARLIGDGAHKLASILVFGRLLHSLSAI